MSTTANRVAKNTGYLYMKMGITMFISLWVTRIILGTLGASDFGVFSIVGGVIGMLGFLNASMANATQRYMSYYIGDENINKCKRIFNASIVLHLIISIAIAILLILAGYFFFNSILNIPEGREGAAKIVYVCLIISTAFTMMTVPYDAVLNAHENMKYYAIVGIIESLLKLAVAYAIVYTYHDKLVVYGILMACIPLITMTIMRVYCHRHYEECVTAPARYWDKSLTKEMGAFAGWRLLNSFSSVFTQYGLGLVLNHFYGTILNAAQGVANQLSGQLMAFCNTMLKALNPVITKSEGKGDRDNMIRATLYGSKFSYILLAVFAIPAILEMTYILGVWLSVIPAWAVLFCQLQLVRSVIEQLTITMTTAIMAQGQIKNFSIIRSVLDILPFALTVLFFYLDLPPYTMYLAWIGSGSILGGITLLYYSHKLCAVSYRDFSRIVLLPCLLMTAVMLAVGIVSTIFMEPSLVRFILTSLSTTVGMVIVLLIIRTDFEKQLILNILTKLNFKSKIKKS